ncbi:tyrosine-type recombinase/integrase [Orrella sp. 11846]|uniref:tyrosine-type recombinase/integrase n=1 Tax=Orrella sp. 11846 TaxID=3409913 RepID=UPI003B5B3A1C
MASIHKTPAGTWRAEVRSSRMGSKQIRKTRTFDTKREAQAWADAVEASIKQIRHNGRILPTDISLAKAMQIWRKETQEHLEKNLQQYPNDPKYQTLYHRFLKDKSRAKLWSEGPLGAVPLKDIKQLDIEAFIDDRREEDRADSTITNDLNLLSRLFKHAAGTTSTYLPPGWRWQIEDPTRAAQQARVLGQSRKRDRRLSQNELNALETLFAAISDAQNQAPQSDSDHIIEISQGDQLLISPHDSLRYIHAGFILAIECALRRGKLFAMTWGWVNIESGSEHLLIPVQYLGPVNKGIPAYLPLSPRAVETLSALKTQAQAQGKAGSDDPVFGGLFADRAYRLLKIACDALSIRDFTWHDLRHEACSRLAEKGWTLPEIQAISGHKTLQSLQRYIHINKQAIHAKFRQTHRTEPVPDPEADAALLKQIGDLLTQNGINLNAALSHV